MPADDMDDMDDMEGAPEEDEPTGDGEPAGYADVARSSRRAASGDGGSRSRGAAQRRGEPARPARGRLTQSLRAPSPFPGFWRSIAVGITTVGSSATLLAVTLLLVPGIWLVLLALGVDHLTPGMLTALALPPIGSLGDILAGGAIYPLGTGALIFLLVATVLRAVILALLAGMAVEVLQYRRVSLVGLLRGLQGAPT
ncbi:MAG: hypothetical protein HY658_02165, partial [Actinobacteria bacterium]|nr:hypothetical protein [Actinomycetota bacterium]